MWAGKRNEHELTLHHPVRVVGVELLPALSQQLHSTPRWSPCSPATVGRQQIHLRLLPP